MKEINAVDIVGSLAKYFVPRNNINIPVQSSFAKPENAAPHITSNSYNNLLSTQVMSKIIDQIANNAASQNVPLSNFQFVNSDSNIIPNAELLKILYKYQMVMNITI